MCEQYIIDVFDYDTLIVSKDFIECIKRKSNIEIPKREFGGFYAIDISKLPGELRENLSYYARKIMAKREKRKSKGESRVEANIKRIEVVIRVVWEPDGIFSGPRRVVSFSLPEELIRELDNYAHKLRLSRSELVAKALSSFISSLKKNEASLPSS